MHPIAVWNDFLELNGRAGCEHTHVVRPQGVRNVLREEIIVCFPLHRFVRNVEQFLMLPVDEEIPAITLFDVDHRRGVVNHAAEQCLALLQGVFGLPAFGHFLRQEEVGTP